MSTQFWWGWENANISPLQHFFYEAKRFGSMKNFSSEDLWKEGVRKISSTTEIFVQPNALL